MKNSLLFIMFFSLFCIFSTASAKDCGDPSFKSKTTTDCFKNEAEKSKKVLDLVEKKVIKNLQSTSSSISPKFSENAIRLFQQSQKDYRQYLKSHCSFSKSLADGDSYGNVWENECIIQTNDDRIVRLAVRFGISSKELEL